MKLKYKYFAVDFDGTIADESNFPKIGPMLPGAKIALTTIKLLGGKISIWTCRSNQDLEDAINWLKENEIPFDYVNQDFPEIANNFIGFTRKICADLYIDNKDIHCIMDGGINWTKILNFIIEE